MEISKQKNFIQIIVEELLCQKPNIKNTLEKYLGRLGWKLHNNNVVPIKIFDTSDLSELPEEAESDLIKAVTRLRDGDLSGSISAACGSLDTVTNRIYAEKNIGDPNTASFQERIKKALMEYEVFSKLENDLIELGWKDKDAKRLRDNIEKSINHAAYVMQTLRSKMGDVHGTKPSLKTLTFDTLKWSGLILSLLKST